jgi:xanthine dehydrogenase small subunit
LTLSDKENNERQIALKDFYLGYKTLDKQPDEIISAITFDLPKDNKFNFEKVCKRQYLDIASVNTAFQFSTNGNTITQAHGAIGGVGPIPKFLSQTCEFLAGKEISAHNIRQAEGILQTEIAPISDARGTIAYKRLLARQLFFAHFITLFPETLQMHDLL